MKITSVKVSYGRTINMGNYESLRLEYTSEAIIAPDEDPSEVTNGLRVALRTDLHDGLGKEMAHLHGADKPTRRG